MKNRDDQINRDFNHLSLTVAQQSADDITYELVNILESCGSDDKYKHGIEDNLIAYILINDNVKSALQDIVDSNNANFKHVKDIANEFLDKSTQNQIKKSF